MSYCARRVLDSILREGPQTTRSLIARYGPKPNWQSLLSPKCLVEHHTSYGRIIGPSRQLCDLDVTMPHLVAPSSAADRAYQQDAIRLLKTQGYVFTRREYKRSGLRGKVHRTDQATRIHMRAPEADHTWPPPTRDDERCAGYPYLYASISGGGIKEAQIRRLIKLHDWDIQCWDHPLIVAVPDAGALRHYHRHLLAHSKLDFSEGPLKLIELPLPTEGL